MLRRRGKNPGTEPKTCEKGPKLGLEYLLTSKTLHCVRTACMAFPKGGCLHLFSPQPSLPWELFCILMNKARQLCPRDMGMWHAWRIHTSKSPGGITSKHEILSFTHSVDTNMLWSIHSCALQTPLFRVRLKNILLCYEGGNSIASGSAPRRQANSQPISQLVRQAVS